MLKTNKHFLYVFIALFIHSSVIINNDSITDKATISTYQGTNGPWKYLEYIFITKPKAELNNSMESYFTLPIGLIGASYAAYTAISLFKNKNTIKTNDIKSNKLELTALSISVFAAGKAAYIFINHKAKQSIQKKTLLNVLQKWDTYKQNFPISLVEYFDELESLYKTENFVLTNDLVSEVFELITHHIEHNFESRYKQEAPKSTQPIEAFKQCTEIWKNLG